MGLDSYINWQLVLGRAESADKNELELEGQQKSSSPMVAMSALIRVVSHSTRWSTRMPHSMVFITGTVICILKPSHIIRLLDLPFSFLRFLGIDGKPQQILFEHLKSTQHIQSHSWERMLRAVHITSVKDTLFMFYVFPMALGCPVAQSLVTYQTGCSMSMFWIPLAYWHQMNILAVQLDLRLSPRQRSAVLKASPGPCSKRSISDGPVWTANEAMRLEKWAQLFVY